MQDSIRDVVNLDRIIHEPSRLVIVAILDVVESADFIYLLHETGLTKGNLSAHLSRLEEAGYILIEKRFRGKVPQTICRLTDAGRTAFQQYKARLKTAIGGVREPRPT